MLARDRRIGVRIPLEMFLNHYIEDRPYRALTTNVSDSGLFVQRVKPSSKHGTRVCGLEFELPGTSEVIWARGEICYEQPDPYTLGTGIRFTAMPRAHARLLRDYCVEARCEHLATLLRRIRRD